MWCVYTRRSTPDHPFTFADLLSLQDEVLAEFKNLPADRQQAILFAEVKPVVTLGARQVHDEKQRVHLDLLRDTLTAKGIDMHSGERGGKETWHGPGQWIGFVLVSLERFTGEPRAVRKAVYQILEKVLPTVRQFEPKAEIEHDDRLGIWSPFGKIVSIGIKVREGYVTSGFAINCYPHETSFYGIDPCGLGQASPDFLFTQRGQNLTSETQREEAFIRMPGRLLSHF